MQNVLPTVELEPVTLIDGVVSPIGGVADVELKKESPVQRARWVQGHGVLESDPGETPLSCVIGADVVRDEKQTIVAPDNGRCKEMNGRNGGD